MQFIELLRMLSDEERNQKVAETLQAQAESISSLRVRVGTLEGVNDFQSVIICVLCGLIAFVAMILWSNRREIRKIRADISGLDSMVPGIRT